MAKPGNPYHDDHGRFASGPGAGKGQSSYYRKRDALEARAEGKPAPDKGSKYYAKREAFGAKQEASPKHAGASAKFVGALHSGLKKVYAKVGGARGVAKGIINASIITDNLSKNRKS